ncbi:MAG: HlyD family efflux transporter periplasmic adaptor subunit [Roseitalea sp.]|jgi:HlyD family secretion protein|nr:HlyD family efflux transporter periplasmic adaptor subunit [Roseitalea sp.]MBO6721681.1 HlyD family efflux transporter periplasmic adaptor subunit [Roseitalea sp.]MBO6743531.1 HlyD family efflux transporter periplasmic adaptor subunit [Roseitalea sp.]
MAKARKRSRLVLTALAVLAIGATLTAAFWPRPALVDMGTVARGAMMVTIDEEGRTRVSEPYVVSTPIAGRLQRVEVDPGDPVTRGETIVAHMLPTNPAALDVRTREQARASVASAEAALRAARADLNAVLADRDLAMADLDRNRRLAEDNVVSDAAIQRTQQLFRVADAAVDTAEAAISMREADLANARAELIGFDDQGLAAALGAAGNGAEMPLYAPADGRILQVMHQSETTLPAGTPIMEIGDVDDALEVVVELISSDAVQVSQGDRVLIEDWGGAETLEGQVARIDPFGITKFSALGVEEQRVPVTIALTGAPQGRARLGHGYRVEARIVVWQTDNAVIVPSSALFRVGDAWAVFAVRDGTAIQTEIALGRNNGIDAQVTEGLEPDDIVILYPSSAIIDGARVAARETR